MAIVDFTVPKNMQKRVEEIIKIKGFASKAEFFRFAAIYFIDILENRQKNEEECFEKLTGLLSREISEHYENKDIPSLKEQLVDV